MVLLRKASVRSLVLVLITIAVLGGAMFLYSSIQSSPTWDAGRTTSTRPAPPPTKSPFATGASSERGDRVDQSTPPASGTATSGATGAPAPAPPAGDRVIGAGDNVWVKSFDKTSGRVTNEFRAARYEPRSDDTVNVTQPQARFYLDDGGVLTIEAARGRVVIPPSTGQRETLRDSRGQVPTRGELYEVTLSLLKTAEATDPIIKCTMNNIVFDNDTFRISTEAYTDAAGNTVPADRVEIRVRGQEYDFDGSGLVIRWDEVDRRLQLLEIAHGERLVVKNPAALQLGGKKGQAARPAEPVVVRWAGPLRMVPGKVSKSLPYQNYRAMLLETVRVNQGDAQLATADVLEVAFAVESGAKPGEPGERPVVISLSGAPAVVQMEGMQTRAAVVSYDTGTGSARLRSSPEFPQVGLQDPDGRTMLAADVEFDNQTRVATLAGPAKFELPLAAAVKGEPPTVMVADAKRLARIAFDPEAGQLSVKSARLEGDVAIDHPQLKLGCETIDLTFATGDDAEPVLRSADATGGVRAVVLDDAGKPQKIQCASLRLATATGAGGRLSPRSLHAEGDVKIDSAQQQISAGLLDVTFDRNVGGAAQQTGLSLFSSGDDVVTSLLAEKNVVMRSADGAGITADRVSLNQPGEDAPAGRLRIRGRPATVGDDRGRLGADLIDFDPATGNADVAGGGKFETAFAAGTGQKPRPATVSWTGRLAFDAAAGAAAVRDGVTIASDQPDGTQVRGSADELLLAFESPGSDNASRASPLAGRRIRDVSLVGRVQFAALQAGPAGELAQRMHLYCQKLVYQPGSGDIVVPVSGRMLVEDRRPESGNATKPAIGSGRGATAFQWADKLSFSPARNLAEMTGDVLVVHQPLGAGSEPLRLNADAVAAELADASGAAPVRTSVQLKRVRAVGSVRFDSRKLEFLATEVELRPQEDVLIARGADRNPATLLDSQGMSKGSFAELWLNTRTQESHMKNFRATVRSGRR